MENKDNTKLKYKNMINVLVIGAGDAGALIIKEIKKHADLNYNIIGFIDDDSEKKGKRINGIKILGGRKDIIKICEDYDVKEIILTMPSSDLKTKTEILNICK
ncbi:MAG TPA: nucleoside-diphosphate sugar epimerase, partial [Clostridium sp.]|nr:nucleoside-diphosphate sugar epimerase [Clostridium sp.]